MSERYKKRMNFNINLPNNRCFKNDEAIVDTKTDVYEALSIDEIVYQLNQIDELNKENQELDEKLCLLTMDMVTTKSYKQLEKENERLKKQNENLKAKLKFTCEQYGYSEKLREMLK